MQLMKACKVDSHETNEVCGLHYLAMLIGGPLWQRKGFRELSSWTVATQMQEILNQ